ncbi:MAG: hypothetical protein EPGJADBJ_04444 [Saprospiraceae bacterium]|nr:hypothetical protein [Saprospiraceae bacterium]
MKELRLPLTEPTEQTPPEHKPILFILLDDDSLLYGGFAGNTFFSGGRLFRPNQVKSWTELPKRLPNPIMNT